MQIGTAGTARAASRKRRSSWNVQSPEKTSNVASTAYRGIRMSTTENAVTPSAFSTSSAYPVTSSLPDELPSHRGSYLAPPSGPLRTATSANGVVTSAVIVVKKRVNSFSRRLQ